MKRFLLHFVLIVLLSSNSALSGQESLEEDEILLEDLYGRLIDNFDDISRNRINDSIKSVIDIYVRSDTVFNHKFDNLRYLGQIISPDSTLKIITWNLVFSNAPGKYYCYFIKKGTGGKANRVYFISANYNAAPVKTDTTYTESDWYGGLYYEMRPYQAGGKQLWILLGIDYGNPLISKKIIEVADLRDDGSLIFGKKWFIAGDNLSYRAVMEYSALATMTLRFVSDESIVFDHLVPFKITEVNDRQFYGPDYSTDSYNFTDGKWILKINVDARNKE
jgi:hypothetical protein